MSDLIDRHAVLKHIEKVRQDALMMDDIRIASILMTGMNLGEEVVRSQPSAEPERKRGKWFDGWSPSFDGTRHWFRECSVCGYGRDDDNPEKDTNFCPDCGADMRGGNDE